jgi:hypothetical protein
VTGRRSNQLNYAPWRAGHCTDLLLFEGRALMVGPDLVEIHVVMAGGLEHGTRQARQDW